MNIVPFFSHQERSKVNFLIVDGASTEDKPLKIPKEVWILVNHLFTKSCDQVGMQNENTLFYTLNRC